MELDSRIKITRDGHVAHLEFDQPETRNSLTLELGLAFHSALHSLAGESVLPRAVVLSGRGDVFSSGGDFDLLASFAEKTPRENKEFMDSFYRLFLSIRNMPFPVIAAVNGHAVGAALAVALACDLRYFVPDGKYSLNFVRIGIHPGMGSTFLVKEAAGLARAQELILTGRYFSGEEAMRLGLCHGLFAKSEIVAKVKEIAQEVASAAPRAVRLAKQSLLRVNSLEEALQAESSAQAETYQTQDFKEAIKAIREKRTPNYKDE